jgi:hypothetical protein
MSAAALCGGAETARPWLDGAAHDADQSSSTVCARSMRSPGKVPVWFIPRHARCRQGVGIADGVPEQRGTDAREDLLGSRLTGGKPLPSR